MLFSEIHRQHEGNSADKWQSYLDVYDQLLLPFQQRNIDLLEVGVCNGGSLEVWERYFPNVQHIVGCDIDTNCQNIVFDGAHIDLVIGDVKQADTLQRISAICPQFDIIIDDGSHTSSDIIATFVRLFPLLKEGGLYIVEDLCCSYWEGWEGGVNRPDSSMQFLKLLADVIHFEHWDVAAPCSALFGQFAAAQGIENVALETVHSVTFYNSLCTIVKKPASCNVLGKRVVSGTQFHVSPTIQTMHDQTMGELMHIDKKNQALVSDAALQLQQQLHEQQRLLQQQNQYIQQLTQHIQQLQQQTSQG